MSQTSTEHPRNQGTVAVSYAPPKRTWRRKLAAALRSWGRATFSRESWMSSVRSLLWVVPLTVLIWVYAEREQVVNLSMVTLTVAPPAGQPGRTLVRFAPGTPHVIHADIRGPQASVEDVKEILESSTFQLDLERDAGPGDHLIDIASVLNKDPRIVAKGAEIRNCAPAEVTVNVEGIREMNLDVKPRPEDAKGLPPLAFTPAKVKVAVPESELKRARDEDRLYVYPNLKAFSDVLGQKGEHTLDSVAVLPAFEDPANAVTVTPTTVQAKFTVSSNERRYRMPNMAIFAATPLAPRADEVKPVLDQNQRTVDVTLIGPEDKIREIENGTAAIPPHAVFDPDLSGNIGDTHTSPLYYQLPPGVRVSEADANKTVTYKLGSRAGGG